MIELLTTCNIVIGISVVLNIVLLIGVRNLLKQNEQFEDNLTERGVWRVLRISGFPTASGIL